MNFPALIKALRPHQWVKNLLLFVPFIMAHQWRSRPDAFISVCVAFLLFSLCASSVYIINDIADLEADKLHRTKKFRPFASGALSVRVGKVMALLIVLVSLGSALLVSSDFFFALMTYWIITTAYTFLLKQIVLLDIITLAALYSVRIFAGAVAAQAPVSQWLLAFSMFIFFSLASMKRYAELRELRKNDLEKSHRRGYISHDLEMIAQFGSSSGYIAIVVLAFYLSSEEVKGLYSHPQFLWLVCPAFFYWISRVWLLAGRGAMHDDPIIFALKDRPSYGVGAFVFACILFAL